MATVVLKPGREKALNRRHPWIFSGAVNAVDGNPESGSTVDIRSARGDLLARGAWSPQSQMRVRVWSFDPDEVIDADFFSRKLERAASSRRLLQIPSRTTAWRVVNAESDGLPGLIVDKYAQTLVVQFLTAGIDYWKSTIVKELEILFPDHSIYERSDAEVRAKEGLQSRDGLLAGPGVDSPVKMREGNSEYLVDIKAGHKTGFYLDQRENRQVVSEYCEEKRVLNCFSYSGGFAVPALLKGAAMVVNVESSSDALQLAQKNFELNDIAADRYELVEANVFGELRKYRKEGRTFDVVILDPPKFIEGRSQLKSGSRGYKDINLLACQLLEPGGILATFSCSGQLDRDLFQKIVADAALDAGRETQIISWLSQAPDHPVALNFPEGFYLKGMICRIW